jgi:hypothetical protein
VAFSTPTNNERTRNNAISSRRGNIFVSLLEV